VEDGVPGWDLIQPLSRSPPPSSLSPAQIFSSNIENPTTILLNRGFIPNPQAASIRAGHEPPPNVGEEIVVEGYLSKLIGQGWSPENMPERGEWFWKDVQRMADWCGGEARGVQPVLVDVIDRESPSSRRLRGSHHSLYPDRADSCRGRYPGFLGYAEGYPTW
jgi:surfeit locus 1 family protein